MSNNASHHQEATLIIMKYEMLKYHIHNAFAASNFICQKGVLNLKLSLGAIMHIIPCSKRQEEQSIRQYKCYPDFCSITVNLVAMNMITAWMNSPLCRSWIF